MEKIAFELTPHQINVVRRSLIRQQCEVMKIDEFDPAHQHAIDEIQDIDLLL